ncbi:hypothetical protein Y1Q_0002158 [Alligator mississippiensis]|uniref:Uncharacterized protein n=1 Tax=Alligator mississippiensis TaxID=8496 RepID=A0A151MQ57_ALLMI|nr:hypothetical protein Y1Q_0002158 [Alligator mississippiensis]
MLGLGLTHPSDGCQKEDRACTHHCLSKSIPISKGTCIATLKPEEEVSMGDQKSVGHLTKAEGQFLGKCIFLVPKDCPHISRKPQPTKAKLDPTMKIPPGGGETTQENQCKYDFHCENDEGSTAPASNMDTDLFPTSIQKVPAVGKDSNSKASVTKSSICTLI